MEEDNENLESLIVQVIETDYSFDLANYSPQLKPILEEWKTSHPDEKYPKHVEWELTALDAMPDVDKERQLSNPYFQPKIEMVDRESDPPSLLIYPDVQGTLADNDAVAYYQDRFQKTENIIRKARYADLIWETLRVTDNREAYQYGLDAARSYLHIVLQYLENNAYIYLINNLHRAAEISILLNAQEIAANVVNCISESLPFLLKAQGYRYISELVETLEFISSKVPEVVPQDLWHQVRDISFQAENALKQQEPVNDLLLQFMVDIIILSSFHLDDKKTAWDYRVHVAEIHEEVARNREKGEGPTNSSMVALKYMQDALFDYQKLVSSAPNEEERKRIVSKIEEIKREVRRLIRQTEEEIHTVSVSAEVPREHLEEYIKPLLDADPEHLYTLLSVYPDLRPSISQLQDQAKQMAEEAPLLTLIGKTHLRDGRKVNEVPPFSDEGTLNEQLNFWFQTHARLLDFIFYRLKEEGRITLDTFLENLEAWEFLDARDLPFLEQGLVHYFAEDYASALHVLVPRIEHMLKSSFEQAGLPSVVVPNERQIREQTFGEFLHRKDVREILADGVWYYLNFSLVDENGLNLRNDIAHGWITYEQCNRLIAQIGLYAILLVTRLRNSPPDS